MTPLRIIKKLNFILEVPSKNKFDTIHGDIISLTKQKITAAIETVFDEFDFKGNYRFDRIKVDLGKLPKGLIDNDTIQKLISELRSEIEKQLVEDSNKVKKRNQDLVLFFIQKGYFPWWASDKNDVFKGIESIVPSSKYAESLYQSLYQHPKYFYRIHDLLKEESRPVLFYKLLGVSPSFFLTLHSFFEDLYQKITASTLKKTTAIREMNYFFLKRYPVLKNTPQVFFNQLFVKFSVLYSLDLERSFYLAKWVLDKNTSYQKTEIKQYLDIEPDIFIETATKEEKQISSRLKIILDYFDFGRVDVDDISLSTVMLTSFFKQVLKEDVQSIIEFLESSGFQKSPIKWTRLAKVLTTDNLLLLLDAFHSKETSVFIFDIYQFLLQSNLINAFDRKQISGNTNDFRFQFYSFFLKSNLKYKSKKELFKNFIWSLANHYTVNYDRFTIDLYQSSVGFAQPKTIKATFRDLFTEANIQRLQRESVQEDRTTSDALQRAIALQQLNFFQHNFLNYIFPKFFKIIQDKNITVSKSLLIDFLVKAITTEKNEIVEQLIQQILLKFSKDFDLDSVIIFNTFLSNIEQLKSKINWDYRFLAAYSDQSINEEAGVLSLEQSNLNYFQRSILDYIKQLLIDIKQDPSLRSFFPSENALASFLVANINKLKGEDQTEIIEQLLIQLADQMNLPYETLRLKVILELSEKPTSSRFDTALLYFYVAALLKDSEKRSVQLDKIQNMESLIEKLIEGRGQERTLFKTLFSYPEVFDKLKETTSTDFTSSFTIKLPSDVQQLFDETLKTTSLNYFQKSVLDYILDRTQQLRQDSKYSSVFSPTRILTLLADFLSKETTEDFSRIFFKVFELLSLETSYSRSQLMDKLFQLVNDRRSKTVMDDHFLSLFYSQVPDLKPVESRQIEQFTSAIALEMSYFQRTLLDYFSTLFFTLKRVQSLRAYFPNDDDLITFLTTAIREQKGEDFSKVSVQILEQFSTKINISFEVLRLNIIEHLSIKSNPNNFDTALLFYFFDALLIKETTRSVTLDKIKNIESLIQKLIEGRKQDRTLFKKILSYPEVFDKLKESATGETVSKLLSEKTTALEDLLKEAVDQYELNYFQKSILEFILDRFKEFIQEVAPTSDFSYTRLIPLLAEFLSNEKSEDFDRIVSKLITLLAKESAFSFSALVDKILQQIKGISDKSPFDYRFLSLFSSPILETEGLSEEFTDGGQRYIELSDLNYFQRSLFDYITALIYGLRESGSFGVPLPDQEELTVFLMDAIKKLKGEESSALLAGLLESFSVLIKLPFEALRLILIEAISIKTSRTRFDAELLFKFMDAILENDATRARVLSKIKNIETLLEKLIEDRKVAPALFKKIFSYPQVFDKLKESSIGDGVTNLIALSSSEEQEDLIARLEGISLNYFQKSILDFIVNRITIIRSDPTDRSVISLAQIIPLLSEYLSKQETEDYETLFPKLIELLVSETTLSYGNWVSKLLLVIDQIADKSTLDYRFLSVFSPQFPEVSILQSSALAADSGLSELNYFQRSLFDYTTALIYGLRELGSFGISFPDQEELTVFLMDAIKKVKGEDYTNILADLLDQISVKINLESDALRIMVLELFSKKGSSSPFDTALLFYYLNAFLKDADKRSGALSKIKNIETLLEKLIENRTEDRSLFKKILSYPEVLEYIQEGTFSKILKYLAPEKQADYKKLLKRILEVIPKNRITEIVSKLRMYASLTILEHADKIRSDQFINEIIQRLIVHDPELFGSHFKKSGLQNTVKEIIASQSAIFSINEIINNLTKSDFLNKSNTYNDPEINQFEYLLNLKNEIDRVDGTTETLQTFESIDEILKDENLLREFLNKNTDDIELFVAFSELSLKHEYDKVLKERVSNLDATLIDFESKLIQLQNSITFSNLPPKSFSAVLRAFILRKLAFNTLDFEELIFDFLSLLLKGKFLNLNRLVEIRKRNSRDRIEKIIRSGTELFLEGKKFSGINNKIREELYLKDLFFYQLKYNTSPPWSASPSVDLKQIIVFVKSKIEAEDSAYIQKLFQDKTVQKTLSNAFNSADLSFQIQLLNLIQFKGIPFQIGLLFKQIIDYTLSQSFSGKEALKPVLFDFFIIEKLWTLSSQLLVAEKIFAFLKGKFETSLKLIFDQINKERSLSDSLVSLKTQRRLERNDFIEIISYFLAFGNVPESLRIYRTATIKEVKNFLTDSDSFKMIVSFIELNEENAENFLALLDKKTFQDNVLINYFSQDTGMLKLGNFFFKEMMQLSPKDYFKALSLLSPTIFISGVKKTSFAILFSKLKSSLPQLHALLQSYINNNFTEKDLLSKSILKTFLVPDKEGVSFSKTDDQTLVVPLEALRYYAEFGSLNFENTTITFDELSQFLKTLLKNERFKVKKLFYDTARFPIKLERLIALYSEAEQMAFLGLINPNLEQSIELLTQILKKYLKIDLVGVLEHKNNGEFILFVFNLWSTKNLVIDNPLTILEKVIEVLISKTTYSLQTLFIDLNTASEKYNVEKEKQLIDEMENFFFQNQNKNEMVSDATTTTIEEIKEDDSIYVENAGLVILWPFLGHLFTRLGLLEDPKTFKDDQALQKAILLTQYMVTGVTEFSEEALVLNKIICGAEVNHYVDVSLPIEPSEIEMCNSLLQNAVLKNWGNLNKSSIQALRETFLIREGVLKKNDKDYLLIVKDKTVDILLKDITWTISIVQTGPMENKIMVEWL